MMLALTLIQQALASYGVEFSNHIRAIRLDNDIPRTEMFGSKQKTNTSFTSKNNQLIVTNSVAHQIKYFINDMYELNDDEICQKYNIKFEDKQFSIDGLESKFYKSNFISTFFNLNDKIFKTKNTLIITNRDYAKDEILQAIQNVRLGKTIVAPESLCLAAYEMKKLTDTNIGLLIFNTRGLKTCVSYYECSNKNEQKFIKKTFMKEIGLGDYFFDEFIRKYIEDRCIEKFKSNDFKIKILPSLVDNSVKEEYYYYDATKLLEDAKVMCLGESEEKDYFNIHFKNAKNDTKPITSLKINYKNLRAELINGYQIAISERLADEKYADEKNAYNELESLLKEKTFKTYHLGTFTKYIVPEIYETETVVINDSIACGAAFLTNNSLFVVDDKDYINVNQYGGKSEEKQRQKEIDSELEVYKAYNSLKEENFNLEFYADKESLINQWKTAKSLADKSKLYEDYKIAVDFNKKNEINIKRRPQEVTNLTNAIEDMKNKLKDVENEDDKKNIQDAITTTEEWFKANSENDKVYFTEFINKRRELMKPYDKIRIMKRLLMEEQMRKEEEERKQKEKEEAAKKALEEGEKTDSEKEEKDKKTDFMGDYDFDKMKDLYKDGMPNFDPKMYEDMFKNTDINSEKYKSMFDNLKNNKDMYKDLYGNQDKTKDGETNEAGEDLKVPQNTDEVKAENNEGASTNEMIEDKEILTDNVVSDVEDQGKTSNVANEDL